MPHLQGRSSLGAVPPTVPIQALDWEFPQNIEAGSQLKSGTYRRRGRKENNLEAVMDPIAPEVL